MAKSPSHSTGRNSTNNRHTGERLSVPRFGTPSPANGAHGLVRGAFPHNLIFRASYETHRVSRGMALNPRGFLFVSRLNFRGKSDFHALIANKLLVSAPPFRLAGALTIIGKSLLLFRKTVSCIQVSGLSIGGTETVHQS